MRTGRLRERHHVVRPLEGQARNQELPIMMTAERRPRSAAAMLIRRPNACGTRHGLPIGRTPEGRNHRLFGKIFTIYVQPVEQHNAAEAERPRAHFEIRINMFPLPICGWKPTLDLAHEANSGTLKLP